MSIYTRTGDTGTTSLYGGKRTSKSIPQIESYGSIDELNSFIGLVIAKNINNEDKELLTKIQKDLHDIMAILSGATTIKSTLGDRVKKFEQKIDLLRSKLPELRSFILPQGTEIACLFHIARTVCRRTERNVVGFFNQRTIGPSNLSTSLKASNLTILKYLNRLSDLFFSLARSYNTKETTI